jgi:transmembrane 9 superfamily member 2/4
MKLNGCFRLLFASLGTANAFYIPGWSIKSYKDGESVPLLVNKVTSDFTQLPYAYYDLPFVCHPDNGGQKLGLNIGQVLRGDRIAGSDYNLEFNKEVECQELCTKFVNDNSLLWAYDLLKNGYSVEWIVDNLPGATAFVSMDHTERSYSSGFPLGSVDPDTGDVYLNNHFTLVLRYRESPSEPSRSVIVGFEVYPKSVANNGPKCPKRSEQYEPLVIKVKNGELLTHLEEIRYTYNVFWREDTTIEWAKRWDMYFGQGEQDDHMHWLAIIHAIVIATLLSIFVGVVLTRTLYRDIQTYRQEASGEYDHDNESALDKEVQRVTTGWKLVSNDVFRRPDLTSFLTALTGSGIQFLVMAVSVIVFSCVGLLNPSYRGGFISYAVFLFAFAGVFAGYVNARLNFDLGNRDKWARGVWLTGILVPASILIVVLSLNFLLWAQASSSALPFGTILALFAIWLLISCPLVLIGAFLGRSIRPFESGMAVSTIPRQIPHRRWIYRSNFIASVGGGLPPFLVIIVELAYVYHSLWQNKSDYYYVYGFLALVSFVLMVTVIEMSIVATYLQLNSEDHRWAWRSFLVGSGSAWWILAYSVYYFFADLKLAGFVSTVLFFAYSLIGCLVYGLITGSIGYLASLLFVRRIYSAIKLD